MTNRTQPWQLTRHQLLLKNKQVLDRRTGRHHIVRLQWKSNSRFDFLVVQQKKKHECKTISYKFLTGQNSNTARFRFYNASVSLQGYPGVIDGRYVHRFQTSLFTFFNAFLDPLNQLRKTQECRVSPQNIAQSCAEQFFFPKQWLRPRNTKTVLHYHSHRIKPIVVLKIYYKGGQTGAVEPHATRRHVFLWLVKLNSNIWNW